MHLPQARTSLAPDTRTALLPALPSPATRGADLNGEGVQAHLAANSANSGAARAG